MRCRYLPTKSPRYVTVLSDTKLHHGALSVSTYRYAIIETVQNKHYKSLDLLRQSLRSQQYFGYPVTFIRYPEVDSGEEFKAKHTESLARLIMGLQGSSQLKQDKVQEICSGDLSPTDGYSLYLTEGSAVVLDYGKSDYSYGTWLYETFMTSVVLDILILQRMILSIYELMLNQITLDAQGLDKLYKIKREHLLALDEYEVLGLSHYGSVHEIIERGQEILRIRDVYNKFTQRLQNIEGLVQVAESKQRAKHERFTRIITTLISALLTLAVADSIIEVIGGWASVLPSRGFFWWLQIPFTLIQTHPTYSTIILYLTILGATLVAVWGRKLIDWTSRKKTAIPTTKPTRTTTRTLVPLQFSVEKINGTVEEKDVSEERMA